MAAQGCSSGRNATTTWTGKQNKLFENALSIYDKETPGRWQNVAAMVGGKSSEEVERHYEILLQDLDCIEAGQVPIPNYKCSPYNNGKGSGGSEGSWGSKDNRKFMQMKLQ